MRRHLLLVGLPGAGKSTVGRLAAKDLKTGFVDVDQVIEREQGVTIMQLFARDGERAFRVLERAVVERVLAGVPVVMAPGGGWIAQPGNFEIVNGRALTVYLETSPESASRRVRGADTRPLLVGEDPLERMRALLQAREAFYGRADATIRTDDRGPEDVAQDVVTLARSRGGW